MIKADREEIKKKLWDNLFIGEKDKDEVIEDILDIIFEKEA